MRPHESRIIANSSLCTTAELPIRLTFCLTMVKNPAINYCEKFTREMVSKIR